jgi:hypothetical protein
VPGGLRRVVVGDVGGRGHDGWVVMEVEARPLSARGAARVQREALDAVLRRHKPSYERLRSGSDIQATARARNELGLAVLEYVGATVALAEARDRIGLEWAASTNRPRMFTKPDPSHECCERAWREYQAARRTGDLAAVLAAREVWRDELRAWAAGLHSRYVAEDAAHAEQVRRRWDASQRLHPEDAVGGRPRSRAWEIADESRERDRQESIRRAEGSLSNPWVPWPRSR